VATAGSQWFREARMSEVKEATTASPQVNGEPAARVIHSCNFRYAGRLSNENARTLTLLHEKLALHVSNALQVYLGAALRLKLVSLEQKPMQDYLRDTSPTGFLVPCALNVLQSNMLMQMDSSLVFPVIDLLLGGTGAAGEVARELTDIDEEILESVSTLIIRQIERTWSSLNLALTPGRAIKTAAVPQAFPMNEKLVLLIFELEVGEIRGPFTLVLPTSFVGFLLRHLKASQSQKGLGLRSGPEPTLRQRMLDCKFQIAADIPQMRVGVRDLIGLAPGMVLKLNTALKASGKLTVENTDIFEALPVRSGHFKAAQIIQRLSEPTVHKE